MASIYNSALAVLDSNLQRGVARRRDNMEYCYVSPSLSIYRSQWLWDSCFHAIVMAHFRPDVAKAELRTLAATVNADGLIPHFISWRAPSRIPGVDWLADRVYGLTHLSNITQPPVLATAVEHVYRLTDDHKFVAELLPALKRYYDYLATTRDPDNDGLVSIISPFESGMDHLPAYDEVLGIKNASAAAYQLANLKLTMRCLALGWSPERILAADHFAVEDVGFNSIYAQGLRAMARLAEAQKDPDATRFSLLARKVEKALIERCYDASEGAFYSLHSAQKRPLRTLTVASLLPLIIEDLPRSIADRLVETLVDPNKFWTPYPVPSVSVSEPSFQGDSEAIPVSTNPWGWLKRQLDRHHLVWRGPTWVNTNWFIVHGLRQHGYPEVAEELTCKTAAMIARNGFWEFYDPFTGAGQGAGDFGWSTLVVDMLANGDMAGAFAPPLDAETSSA